MRLVPSSNDKSQINYQYESPTKTQACKPGACLLTVISLENIAPLPTTVVVRGVFQRPDLNLNVPQEFLLSATDVQKYGLAAGKTSDIGVEATPKFSRTVGGVTYTQALEVGGSNYDNLANAKKWFDTPEAKAAHAIITTLSTAPDS
jgi:hypothetical protein